MRIVKPYARMMPPPGYLPETPFTTNGAELRRIEWCSRISHRSEEAQSADSFSRFLRSVVIDHGDWSVVEHISASVDCLTDRGITHEIVRHRLFSYTQESTRFVNYTKEKDGKPKNPACFIYPVTDVECRACTDGYEPKRESVHDDFWMHRDVDGLDLRCDYDETWLGGIQHCEAIYRRMVEKKWRPQEARSVFPNALASRIIITGNLRNWRHFFIMRTTQEAHPQMRQIMIPLLSEFKQTFPILFDDIEPNQKQSNNLRLPR